MSVPEVLDARRLPMIGHYEDVVASGAVVRSDQR